MNQKLKMTLAVSAGLLLVAGTGLNGWWLRSAYAGYKNGGAPKTLPAAKVIPKTNILSAKQKKIDAGRLGVQAEAGNYKYLELEHSRVDTADHAGRLVLATEHTQNASFVMAGNKDLNLSDDSLNSGWSAQLVSSDAIWQPASCASKPTYLIGGRYIFIDDGKTNADDKYNSYVSFDMVDNKFRYFGGNNFTPDQATKEHILSIQNENGQVVFYIDHADPSGPLAGSSSFKHAAAYASKYITRRVIDMSTLQYQDFKIPYQVPAGVQYYFVDSGRDFSNGQIAELASDTSTGNGVYEGTVNDNLLTFTFLDYGSTKADGSQSAATDSPGSDALDQSLAVAMPDFIKDFNADQAHVKNRFYTRQLGSTGSYQFLVASQSWTPDFTTFENLAVYDTTTHQVNVLTSKPVLKASEGSNYVPLGVF